MEVILLDLLQDLLHDIATSRDLMSITLAAGVAHERLLDFKASKDEAESTTTKRPHAA